MNKNILKSIGSILAGMLLIVVLSITTDFVLEKLKIVSPADENGFSNSMLIVAFFYRSLYAILGGYLAALLAPANPLKHAVILGIIGMVLSTLGAVAMWDKGSHWYSILLLVTALPTCWLGGKMAEK